MMSTQLASDITRKLFISDSGVHARIPYFNNEDKSVPHEVLFSPFTLEYLFSKLHPRMLCRAARVCRAWREIAYAQRALWSEFCVGECVRSALHAETLLQPRFELLRSLRIPASLVKSHGSPTHCAQCTLPLPEYCTQEVGIPCRCRVPLRDFSTGDLSSLLHGRFAELEKLSLQIPSRHSIDPACLAQMTQLTQLRIENMNPVCAQAFGALITRNAHQLRGLTYLTRPWVSPRPNTAPFSPFSYSGLHLESLEVNQLDFDDILHMTSTLTSLKINGYAPIDKYMNNTCMQHIESIVCFTQLETLDISGLNPTEVSNPAWTALHICMLTNLQRLDVGPMFGMEDFAWMSRDLVSLRSVGIHDNIHFSNTILQDFAAMDIAANITSLHFRNCMDALREPECLTSFPHLRTLHIQQDTQQAGISLRKLVPTIVQMTRLVDLSLIGLSINPVQIYPKLTNLQRLVLNRTPMSDADVLIMTKKLPSLRHLGLVGCYHVTLKGLLSLISAVNLQVLEWDEPTHVKPLLEANPELNIIMPQPVDELQPLVGLTNLDPPPEFNPLKLEHKFG